MKYLTDHSPKVALKRNLSFWRLRGLASIVYKTLLDADRHLSPCYFQSWDFGKELLFPLHHLVDFKPEAFSVPSLPCLGGSTIRDCKKMILKASLVSTVGFSPDGYNLHARGPISPPAFSWCYEGKKIKQFLTVWNAFPGNWQQSSSQVYDLDSNLDFPYAFLTLWERGWI